MGPSPAGCETVNLEVGIDSTLEGVAEVGASVRALCTRAGVSDAEAALVELAVVEAVTNSIAHGYQGRPGGHVHVRAQVDRTDVRVEVEDGGPPVDPGRLRPAPEPQEPPARADLAEGGRGLTIIRGVFQDVAFARVDGHNRLTLRRRREAPRP